ncbi:MAG: family 78 glycoside hydrolase catalytic domain [Candidatus Sumerlaeota bacterium]|nr:family 78 glycoside hydrolase catalytic domain [Candidatus Sumerlaeota bacterium]
MPNHMKPLSVLAVAALGAAGYTAHAAGPLAADAWEEAQWIGFVDDQRPAELAERPFARGKTPADLSKAVQSDRQPKPILRRSFPSPLLRKAFAVEKPVRSAQVSVCGLGLYELFLNGKKVGDRVLDPAQTSYDKRAFYVTHDVAGLLQQGSNVIGLMLGNGFYGQNIALSGGGLAYGEPRATLLLTIEYEDGFQQTIVSDNSWKAAQGPVLFDNIYSGETFDARRERADWSSPGFDDSDWKPVVQMTAPTANLMEQPLEPMRKIRSIKPVAALPAKDGEWILDMGQNMTGWLNIRVHEDSDRQIRMRFAELLMPDGNEIDTASTGVHVTGGDQTDIYVCKGGVEEWEPRFTYHGFRYVQISGLSKKPELSDFTGWLVRTDVERIGTFECSDALINKFYNVSLWTIEDNLQGILTDCPHRERCAWMGDNEAVGEAASYNFDLRRFWPKISADMETVLGAGPPRKESGLPRDPRAPCNIAVGKRLCNQARPDWGAATVLVPWFDWLYYGDLETVKTAWPMMQGWMAFLEEFAVKDGIITEGYGDWCPPGSNSEMDTPVALTSTALYYQSLEAMVRMATALGKLAEADRYAALAVTVKQAFIKRFYDSTKHDFGSQTGTAMALHLGLVPAGEEPQVAAGLAALIMERAGGHYTTGIFGHRPLYTVLNDYGYGDVTRHLWSITDWPSLGFMTEKHGLTTWPEVPYDWPAGERYRRNSFNHPMHSGFAAVFHESLGGIRPDPANPGFRRFFLKPCFLPGLEWAKAEHRSPYGLISSHWKRDGGSIAWEVSAPPGSAALVQLPQVAAGKILLGGEPVQSNEFELPPGAWSIRIDP